MKNQLKNKQNTFQKYLIAKNIMKLLIITTAICLVLLIIAPFIAIPIFLNRHVDYRGYATDNYPMQDIYQASDFGLKEKQMYLTTSDGLNIWTSEISSEQPKAIIIYLSGILQPSVTYFYGHAKYMQEKGYASFLLEVRGHGNSDGKKICLGYEEVKDVQAVIEYIKSVKEYEEKPIIIHGVSMGGAIAVNAFGQIKEIDAVIAMSAYSSFEDVLEDSMGNFRIPRLLQKLEKFLLRASLKLSFGSASVNNMKPLEQIKNANGRPMLLISCSGDIEVPMINTQRLHEMNPEAEIWQRDSWEHFIVKNCDFKKVDNDDEYCKRILDFIEIKVLTD